MPTDEYDVQLNVARKTNTNHDSGNFSEMSLDDLASVLDSTIKHDKANKCIVFLGMLTTYTESDQLNVCLLGESSSGKTYLAQEIASYFPQEDIYYIAEATKKAFIYDENRTKEDKDSGHKYLNLERVILLFQDMPSPDLLKELRPLLSHDKKELQYLNVNKGGQGRNKTDSVYIRGFPSVTFCSANIRINPQEATRTILLSPETSKEKIEASVWMAVEKSTNPEKFKQMVDSDSQREKLKERIKFIKELSINSVIVPFPPRYIVQKYRSINPTLSPRDNRDVRHILSLIKAVAMLNAYNRLDEHRNVVANEHDVEEGFKLWEGIARTQEYGIAPAALQFYEAFIVPAYIESHQKYGISVEELCEYCRKNRKKIASYTITKDLLPALISSNLVFYDHVEEISKKRKYIRPLNLPELNESKDDLPLSEPQKAETEAIHHPQNHQEIGKEEIWTGGSYRDYEDSNRNNYLADLI